MKAVYLDCFAGISGNMLLGAFLQLGVPQKHLEQELHKLITGDEFELHVSDVMKNGIQAKYVDVEVKGTGAEFESKSEDDGAHGHTHEHDGHDHVHRHDFGHTPEHLHRAHVHRSMLDIRRMIEDSELSDAVKK
ncbi:MAG: DUF111 family protein, partial [Schwartzia sp.]|nr:DUF111 family protein [Schwartzia sp. (in: firmicutes)]